MKDTYIIKGTYQDLTDILDIVHTKNEAEKLVIDYAERLPSWNVFYTIRTTEFADE